MFMELLQGTTVLGSQKWKDNRTKYLALRRMQFIMRLEEYTVIRYKVYLNQWYQARRR